MTAVAGSTLVRFLTTDDVGPLMELERQKWTDEQATSAGELVRRIEAYPDLCVGAFCRSTAVGSLVRLEA
ncbi:hypothetical protein [Pengzhenrongella sp.]|jgi:hypothetical protein|uniref:hypothetical protein n=1 Tax=Pengzhenrongella sp. TaxID=2888820 RepID=UPI002F926C9F